MNVNVNVIPCEILWWKWNVRSMWNNFLHAVNSTVYIRTWFVKPCIRTPPRCFSTAVKWWNCINIQLQFLHMIFNTQKKGQTQSSSRRVLKIVWKNWNIIVMQLQHLTVVEKHLAINENVVDIGNWFGKPCN